jgi:hypothetical protein
MLRIIGLTIFAVATIACGRGGGPLSPSSGATLVVSDSINVPHSFDIGRTYSLIATLRKSGGGDEDVTGVAQWKSSDSGVATVAGNVVHVQALGEVDVTATYRDAVGTFHISVTAGEIIFRFSSFVTQPDQQVVRDAIAFGQSYFASTFGWTLTSKLTVTAGPGSPGATGVANRTTMMLFTDTPYWNGSSADGRQRIVLHEFFHVLQLSTGWGGGVPRWLMEGAAEYVGFRAAIIDRGVATADAVRACHEHYVDAHPVPIPALSELSEFYDGTRAPYVLGYLAADQLVANRGLTSFMTFGTSIDVSGFLPSFERAFGTPLTAFYSQFEVFRHSWPHTSESVCGTWF